MGSLHRFRDAVEHGWPRDLETEQYSHLAMASACEAGAAGLHCAFFRSHRGADLSKENPKIKFVTCPFTGEELACVPSIRPGITVIYVQKSRPVWQRND